MKHIFFLMGLVFSFNTYAKSPSNFYELPEVVAVQNRPYYIKHDLTFTTAWMPSDAFNKGVSVGSSYTYYFKDYLAWEVINFNYIFNYETNLKKEMNNLNIDFESEGFGGVMDILNLYATSSLVYTPFYNKSLAFNETVVHGYTSFVLGAGIANFEQTGARPLITAGAILRFFSSPTISWKMDVRNNIYFEETLGAVNTMSIGVGFSIELGESPKKSI